MDDSFPHSTRQERLAGVSDSQNLTAATRDQALGVAIPCRRFAGMKCDAKLQ
jgi:hypothetical protein